MKNNNWIYVILVTISISCYSQKQLPVLKTNSKVVSIKEGDIIHPDIWTISPEVEFDEFVCNPFTGKKEITFYSDIDTLKISVKPENNYDFIIQYNDSIEAHTRISTFSKKEPSILPKKILYYKHIDESKNSETDTISFKLSKDGRIFLEGKINQSNTLNILFDTGADALVITKSLVGKKVKMKFDREVQNEGSDGIHMVSVSENNTVEVGNLIWNEVPIIAIDYKNRLFDAVMGWNAFENKIIEINYDKQILVVHNEMKTVPSGFVKVQTKMIGGIPYIKGTVTIGDNNSSGWFEYDSGSDSNFLISQKFASENNLNGKMEVVGTSAFSGSAGIKWKANNYILPKLKLGEFELYQIPISIAEKDAEGTDHNDILGNKLLKRFNAIIDFKNYQIYLKPNNLIY
jgi:hypothetical protein